MPASVSALASAIHGWAHVTIPVESPAWRVILVVVLLFLAPAVGVALLASGRRIQAIWPLLLAGLGDLVFEGLLDFVIPNSDRVATVDTGAALFTNTTPFTTASDLLLVLAAGWVLWRQAQGSSNNSSIASMR